MDFIFCCNGLKHRMMQHSCQEKIIQYYIGTNVFVRAWLRNFRRKKKAKGRPTNIMDTNAHKYKMTRKKRSSPKIKQLPKFYLDWHKTSASLGQACVADISKVSSLYYKNSLFHWRSKMCSKRAPWRCRHIWIRRAKFSITLPYSSLGIALIAAFRSGIIWGCCHTPCP